jgi:hypothetical protein
MSDVTYRPNTDKHTEDIVAGNSTPHTNQRSENNNNNTVLLTAWKLTAVPDQLPPNAGADLAFWGRCKPP